MEKWHMNLDSDLLPVGSAVVVIISLTHVPHSPHVLQAIISGYVSLHVDHRATSGWTTIETVGFWTRSITVALRLSSWSAILCGSYRFSFNRATIKCACIWGLWASFLFYTLRIRALWWHAISTLCKCGFREWEAATENTFEAICMRDSCINHLWPLLHS